MSETFVKDFRPIKIDMHGVRLPRVFGRGE